jgi:NitT/TauT family transport system substrate-binding protein
VAGRTAVIVDDFTVSGSTLVEVAAALVRLGVREVYAAITPNGCNPDGQLNEASLRKDLDFFKERKLIEGNVTVDQVIDHSFVEAALKELGPYKPKK